ncbi:MAG: HD domain-containing protein [Leptolyngbya sp. SIO4C1]|nr:HD domain-containing protein [Leptolyngbya sp. SIO4C1]
MKTNPVVLTAAFDQALAYAAALHRYQQRKLTGVPYVAHLMAVAALVLEDGGGEIDAIAALLHDAVEDQGGLATLQAICDRFGQPVADLVWGCTEPPRLASRTWRDHKRQYLAQIAQASPAVQRIMLADKLHNVRSLWGLLQQYGPGVWQHFSGGQENTLWLYGEYAKLFETVRPSWMTTELQQLTLALKVSD